MASLPSSCSSYNEKPCGGNWYEYHYRFHTTWSNDFANYYRSKRISLRAVPNSYYQGSIALGASHEKSVMSVILPAAGSGILSSVILGIGRAIGETMAVVLVAGNQARIPESITQGTRTMTTNIVLEMAYAAGEHREALIATASVLFIFILLINAGFLILKRRRKY